MDSISLVRALYAAFANGDMEHFVGALDGDIEWDEAAGFPLIGGRHVGVDAVVGVLSSLPRDWDAMWFEPREFLADGDLVVVLGDTGATWRATGASYTTPFAHRWRLRDNKVIGWRAYLDTALAQAATRTA